MPFTKLHLSQPILRAIANIEAFAQGYDATALAADTMRLHAVVFDLSIVGEALKRLDAVRPDLTAGLPASRHGPCATG